MSFARVRNKEEIYICLYLYLDVYYLSPKQLSKFKLPVFMCIPWKDPQEPHMYSNYSYIVFIHSDSRVKKHQHTAVLQTNWNPWTLEDSTSWNSDNIT